MVVGFREEQNIWKKHMEFIRRGKLTFTPDGIHMLMEIGDRDRIKQERLSAKAWVRSFRNIALYGYGKQDLFITFKQVDGSWGDAVTMEPQVNSANGDIYATVSADGKYLMFNWRIDDATDNTNIILNSAVESVFKRRKKALSQGLICSK